MLYKHAYVYIAITTTASNSSDFKMETGITKSFTVYDV